MSNATSGIDTYLGAVEKDGHKFCTSCGDQKELSEGFDKDADKPDGFRNTCKTCRAKLHVEKEELEQDRAIIALQEEGLEVLSEMKAGGALAPHCSEMFEAVMMPFGGVNGYSRYLWADYLASKPGSAAHLRIHSMIIDLCKEVSKLDLAEKRMDMLNDDDLARVLEANIESFEASTGIEELQATPQKQIAATVANGPSGRRRTLRTTTAVAKDLAKFEAKFEAKDGA